MAKSEQAVLRELVKLRRAILRKETDPKKKRVLRRWIKDDINRLRMHKHARSLK